MIWKKFAEKRIARSLFGKSFEAAPRPLQNSFLILFNGDDLESRDAVKSFVSQVEMKYHAKCSLVSVLNRSQQPEYMFGYEQITNDKMDFWRHVKVENYSLLLSKTYTVIMNLDMTDNPSIHEFVIQFKAFHNLSLTKKFRKLYDIVIPFNKQYQLKDYLSECLVIFEKIL